MARPQNRRTSRPRASRTGTGAPRPPTPRPRTRAPRVPRLLCPRACSRAPALTPHRGCSAAPDCSSPPARAPSSLPADAAPTIPTTTAPPRTDAACVTEPGPRNLPSRSGGFWHAGRSAAGDGEAGVVDGGGPHVAVNHLVMFGCISVMVRIRASQSCPAGPRSPHPVQPYSPWMWPAIHALTATLTMTEYRSPPVWARESGTPARTRASSGLPTGGIGALAHALLTAALLEGGQALCQAAGCGLCAEVPPGGAQLNPDPLRHGADVLLDGVLDGERCLRLTKAVAQGARFSSWRGPGSVPGRPGPEQGWCQG